MTSENLNPDLDTSKNKTELQTEDNQAADLLSHSIRGARGKSSQSANEDRKKDIIFKKGICAREIKVNMFLLEGRSGFERLLLREKQTVLINES